ncbi:hypothetical protein [Crocinitomix catalasitica]|uniref:hypothetical protein n=1 Tax=Crocinitomix catalasitica TaxID=184607 RepID=UPI00048471F1|nr:hypothetical protein [Crocinitomix catalasitica]
MCTKRKSKWFAFISIGLLMIVLPNIIDHIHSISITELTKTILMVVGITLELIGIILISGKSKQTQHQ